MEHERRICRALTGYSPALQACNVVAAGEPIKTIDAVRRLECDRHAGFGYYGVKVASDWMLHPNIPGKARANGSEVM
jgi:hypothetical protein